VTLCGFWSIAYGEMGFRCEGHIIDVGDSEAELMRHCGQPTSRDGSLLVYDQGPEADTIEVTIGVDGMINRIHYVPQ